VRFAKRTGGAGLALLALSLPFCIAVPPRGEQTAKRNGLGESSWRQLGGLSAGVLFKEHDVFTCRKGGGFRGGYWRY
jgi:hypothetical protein